jgi:uncharacterized glyoxalase superfamily protein PhnB
MMKSGVPIFIVDSVEDAIKFYSDKLAFDLVEIMPAKGNQLLIYAHLRKGKCQLMLRAPKTEELVEFSQIKYCMSRGAGMYVEMKKGLQKYYQRCKSKGVQIISEPADMPWGQRTFTIKDPFGFKVTFGEPIEGFNYTSKEFLGMAIDHAKGEDATVEKMVNQLRSFGLSRRSSKKFSKLWLKEHKRK